MADGNVVTIYSRPVRDTTGKIGRIKSGSNIYEFSKEGLSSELKKKLKKGVDGFTAEDILGWHISFEPEGKYEVSIGSIKKRA